MVAQPTVAWRGEEKGKKPRLVYSAVSSERNSRLGGPGSPGTEIETQAVAE